MATWRLLFSSHAQMRTSEERMAKLRAEMLLREENYNNHFKNGGAGTKMLNPSAAMNAQVRCSRC